MVNSRREEVVVGEGEKVIRPPTSNLSLYPRPGDLSRPDRRTLCRKIPRGILICSQLLCNFQIVLRLNSFIHDPQDWMAIRSVGHLSD